MAPCWLSTADSGCLPREWFEVVRTGSSSDRSRVGRRNAGVNETLVKIELEWLELAGSRPIFIRGGE